MMMIMMMLMMLMAIINGVTMTVVEDDVLAA